MLRRCLLIAAVAGAALPSTAAGADYVVSNSFDAGAGSLRQAIIDANGHPNSGGPDTISFGNLGSSPKITPDTGLPAITEAVVIDGYTHPGASPNTLATGDNAVLKVELSGEDLAGAATGLTIDGGGTTVRGLVINRFDAEAAINIVSSGNVVAGNFIGTDRAGTADPSSVTDPWSDGVRIGNVGANTIGGESAAARNIISGNGEHGIEIWGAGAVENAVRGNYIGTDRSGSAALGNAAMGVFIDNAAAKTDVGGSTARARNVISGNYAGVAIYGNPTSGTVVRGNYIGTDASGRRHLGNSFYGIHVQKADDSVIGGTAAGEGNVISGSHTNVEIFASTGGIGETARGTRVEGNRIGTNARGTAAIDAGSTGLTVSGLAPETVIGGLLPRARNVISGNATGLYIDATGATVRGNFVGTDASGTAAVPNRDGVVVGAQGTVVGGTTAAARNVISGNEASGILVQQATNSIHGNYIGVDAAGQAALPNENGILADAPATVGGSVTRPGTGGGNVISGNREAGIVFTGESVVQGGVGGNVIGTDATGTRAVPNGHGVVIERGADGVTVGFAGAANVISGNDLTGVSIRGPGSDFNLVYENYIGLDRPGLAAVPNGVGVEISGGARWTGIGGSRSPGRNVIAGNRYEGVWIHGYGTSDTTIQNARIGVRPDGARLANRVGVRISAGATGNTIGATSPGGANLISGNTTDGVLVTGEETAHNRVLGNYIGTTPGGTGALGNDVGVHVTGGARFNTIGRLLNQPRSVISGNRSAGVRVDGAETIANRILGNLVGVGGNGTTPIPNGVGVHVRDAEGTIIGGTSGRANRIGRNTGSGVLVDGAAAGTDLIRNEIFGNGKLAINLRPAGEAADVVTPNDAADPDTGPNALQNFPVITVATGSPGTTTISGSLNSTPRRSFRIEVFRNLASGPGPEAAVFVADASVSTNASGNASWTLTVPVDLSGQIVRATATQSDVRNTSELSASRTVG